MKMLSEPCRHRPTARADPQERVATGPWRCQNRGEESVEPNGLEPKWLRTCYPRLGASDYIRVNRIYCCKKLNKTYGGDTNKPFSDLALDFIDNNFLGSS